jgi:Zn finger protein HypA/HybF involved in hydrogenase expression
MSFSRVAKERIEIEESSDLVLSPICPACNHDYMKEKMQMCPECGSSRPMIKS